MTPAIKKLTAGSSGTDLTIAAGIARGLMNFAVSRGADKAALAKRAAIAPEALEGQDNRVPLTKYIALMHAGQDLCGDPALALHYAEAVGFGEVSIVGLLGFASETMLQALEQMNRYGRLAVEFDGPRDRFVLSRERDGLWLTDTRRNANDFPELTETTFGRMAMTFREMRLIKAVHVTHPQPAYRAEYDRIFAAPITFDSGRNALHLDDAWEHLRLAPSPRYVFGILCERADALLADLESSKSIRSRVESLLMPILHTGKADMATIAGKMGLSRQTLFRRLKAEGVTFEKVLDELRYKLALGYLRGKKVSVNETAYLVGFSEPAAFSRAFKRWTGASPRNMRAAAARSAE